MRNIRNALKPSGDLTMIVWRRSEGIGKDVAEALEFAMALGPAGEIIRLAGDEGEKRKKDVTAALPDTLSPYARETGVWAPSSTWFVNARDPR